MESTSLASGPTSAKAGNSKGCDGGCVAGIVIGSVTGGLVLLMLVILLIIWCSRRRGKAHSSTSSQMDLIDAENPSVTSERFFELCEQHFSPEDKVFCKFGHTCAAGQVVASAGDGMYRVKFRDGSIRLINNSQMAPHFSSDASVHYQPPSGGESISCTIIHADGSYWPPFYQIRPDNSSLDSINTTAEHLLASSKQPYSVFSSEIIARAV